jgi:hypothetical protein
MWLLPVVLQSTCRWMRLLTRTIWSTRLMSSLVQAYSGAAKVWRLRCAGRSLLSLLCTAIGRSISVSTSDPSTIQNKSVNQLPLYITLTWFFFEVTLTWFLALVKCTTMYQLLVQQLLQWLKFWWICRTGCKGQRLLFWTCFCKSWLYGYYIM